MGFVSAYADGKQGEREVVEYYDNKFKINPDYKGFTEIKTKEQQKTDGDYIFHINDTDWHMEIKTDKDDGKYGNMVFETESNKGYTIGWLHGYERVDYFCYYYPRQGFAVISDWKETQKFVLDNKDRWRVVNQNVYKQKNIPVNYLVPYKTLLNEVSSAKEVIINESIYKLARSKNELSNKTTE